MASKLWDGYIVDGSDRKVNIQTAHLQEIEEGMKEEKLSEKLFNQVRSTRGVHHIGPKE